MSTVTVVPTVDLTSTPPRVQLAVTDTGTPNLFATTVTRLDPDGVWRNVRTNDGNPLTLTTSGANRVGTLYDYEAPYGAAVSYSTIESPTVASAQVTVDEDQIWLVNPGVPALSMPLNLRPGSLVKETFPVKQGVFYPMGRSTPVVRTDGRRKSSQTSIVVVTQSSDELDALMALIADAGVLLLNVPGGLGVGFATSYIAVGDVDVTRWTDTAIDWNRDVTLPFVVVDMPVGGSQSARSYADLLDYSSYAQLQGAYATYADLLAGP